MKLLRHTGTDADVASAARVSTLGTGAVDSERPVEGLINYLMRDRHGSPFEHNSFTFCIEAPIFVAREFMRHRVGFSYNEESGRYRELEPVFYVPGPGRPLKQEGKPGMYAFKPGSYYQYLVSTAQHRHTYASAWEAYQYMLNSGIAREVARSVLPVGIFTTFYATCNARSLMHFLSLRTKRDGSKFPSFPQREIEMVAEQMEDLFKEKMPTTAAIFEKNGRVAP